MRNFSNQSSSRPAGGNRGGYRGQGGPGGYNRENRENRENRGNYRGNTNGNRFERNEGRGGDRRPSFGNRRPSGNSGPYGNRSERHDRGSHPRHERSERPEGSFPRGGSSWVEVSGRSIEEAIEESARRFNVGKNDLKTEVVDEGSKGFLGIGSKPAKVKVSLKSHAVVPFAEGVLSRLLRGMSLPDKVKSRKDTDGNTVLNIEGPSSGTLIGRHGHTLDSLQYLVSKMVQRLTGDERTIVIVDVENYLERQKDKLKELAMNLAQKAKETGVEIPMRPMSSKDRRIVHMTLKDHEHVTTESRGEGLRRRVVIVPKVKATEVTPEAVAAAAAAGDVEPGNTAPPEDALSDAQPIVESQPPVTRAHTGDIEPGNAVPKEPELDDNIGNRV
jgi:spoIIIJ-associated protein